MSAPHLCPMCHGWKQVERPAPIATALNYVTCPVCNGLGVLWEFRVEAKCDHLFESNPGMWDTLHRYCKKCGVAE